LQPYNQEEEDLDLPNVGRNTKLLEYSDLGTGDYRSPSFKVVYPDGGTICPLSYKSHSIVRGKLPMTSGKNKLPEIRGGDKGECNSLVVRMEDRLTGLELSLIYVVYRDCDAIVRRAIVKAPEKTLSQLSSPGRAKPSTSALKLEKIMSATVDFHCFGGGNYITLSGSWANERHIRVQELTQVQRVQFLI
jgi:alpha-galactosidase